jgi:hypothetical protein
MYLFTACRIGESSAGATLKEFQTYRSPGKKLAPPNMIKINIKIFMR